MKHIFDLFFLLEKSYVFSAGKFDETVWLISFNFVLKSVKNITVS